MPIKQVFPAEVSQDADGNVTIGTQIPFQFKKEVQADGSIKYSVVVNDDGTEREIAYTIYVS